MTGAQRADRSTLACDYLVVGAGAAGCVVASRLSEDPAARVVLLEAGPARRGPMTRVPATAFLASIAARTNWNHVTEPVPALNGRRLQLNQGRILGGSSSINGMLYMRGALRDYDHWRQLGCTGWSGEEVLAAFRRAEASDRGAGRWHGAEGPLSIRRPRLSVPICQAFLEAVQAAGFPLVDDMNADVLRGFGFFDTNIRRGRRHGVADAYIDPVRGRPNLTVLTDSQATEIVLRGGRATGVRFRGPQGMQTVEAEREVILCGGALNTPQLLLLSGIGPAEELRALGIAPVLDRPGVGRNLHNHPSYALTYALKDATSAWRYAAPHRALGLAARYLATGGGALGESYVATGGVFASDPALEIPDAMVVMMPALIKRGTVGARLHEVIERRHGFTVLVSLARQRSRGSVTLRSSDPFAAPAIRPDYYSDPADMPAMVAMVQQMREAMRQAPVAGLVSEELQPPASVADTAGLEADIRARGGSFYHPGGTCRMGSDEEAVVDPRLRLRGIEGLRVADASIAPAPLNASMHAPCIMIGEKAAQIVKEDNDPAGSAPRGAADRAA